jgi:aconitate hydratase
VRARRDDGSTVHFSVTIRIDTPQEVLYYQHGGILPYVLRQLLSGRQKPRAISGPAAILQAATPSSSAQVDEGSKELFPASDPPAY